MISSSVLKAETELRHAVERRQGGDVSKYLADYGEAAGNQVASISPGDPMRLEILKSVLSVLEWAKLMLRTRRAVLGEDLRLLSKVDRFLGDAPPVDPRFRLDL